jgi:hypothetical protein
MKTSPWGLSVAVTVLAWLGSSVGLAKPVGSVRAQRLVLDPSPAAREWVASMPGSQLYRSKVDPKGLRWAIDAGALTVSRVRWTDAGIEVVRTWNFATMVGEDQEEGLERAIDPVLYPVGLDRLAMALLTKQSTGYSGGGAWWTFATFYELRDHLAPDDVGEGRLAPVYQAIPFACAKDIRACFSEREYRRAGRCSESWSGALRLRMANADRNGTMAWTATWEETHIPGGLTKAGMTVARTVIDLANPPTTQCTEPM